MTVERSAHHQEGINCPEHQTAAVGSRGFFLPSSSHFLNIAAARRRAKPGHQLPLTSRCLCSLIVRRKHDAAAAWSPALSGRPGPACKKHHGNGAQVGTTWPLTSQNSPANGPRKLQAVHTHTQTHTHAETPPEARRFRCAVSVCGYPV